MKKYTPKRASVVGEYAVKSGSRINCAALGNTSCGVFCTGDDGKNVSVWTVDSQVPVKVLGPHNSEISSVVFSQDERFVFAGTAGGSIHMWDLEAQRISVSFREHRVACSALGVPCTPGMSTLVSGSQDTNVKMWDLRSGKSYCTFKEHDGVVSSVCFAPSGQWIASGDETGMVKVWEPSSAKLVADLKCEESPVMSVAFNPVFCTLASSNASKVVRYWDLEKFALVLPFRNY